MELIYLNPLSRTRLVMLEGPYLRVCRHCSYRSFPINYITINIHTYSTCLDIHLNNYRKVMVDAELFGIFARKMILIPVSAKRGFS